MGGLVGLPYKYREKWKKEAGWHLLAAIVMLAANVHMLGERRSNGDIPWLLLGTALFLTALEVWRGMNYLRLPDRDYVVIDEGWMKVDRGFLLPGKKVALPTLTEREYEDGELVLKRADGTVEARIEIDALEEKDFLQLQERLDPYVEAKG